MRKHCVRKWIHAICDLLPLLVIPIFALAVRSDNNFEPISVEYETKEVIVFNQLLDNSNYSNEIGGLYLNVVDNSYVFNGTSTQSWAGFRYFDVEYVFGHQYLLYCKPTEGGLSSNAYLQVSIDGTYYTSPNIFTFNGVFNYITTGIQTGQSGVNYDHKVYYFGIYDLTLMFGSGNEPTYSDFVDYFPSDYYQYNLGTKQLLNTGSSSLNSSDVGSQMVYTLYNTCDKYFNFNNVGVFQDLYTWFETNVFHGSAPMSFYIVWNVILYEFIMDLIFLTYMVFMFVIDFTEHLIDGFFDKAYRGGR